MAKYEFDPVKIRGCRTTGANLAGLLKLRPADITQMTADGIFRRTPSGYQVGENIDSYLKHLGKKRGRPPGESRSAVDMDDKTELEKRKLQAQIDAIELKNVRVLTELKQEAFTEAMEFIASQCVHLREALRGDARVERAFNDMMERIDAADAAAITAKGDDAGIDDEAN